ncbi:putative disease resistance protein RGA3 [Salvia hispanica]|uniref:putative disease resistance protein RGA3 n=1 Tax=Salvia hispanica TaxID=49212 RepID=UPI002009C168|nr:putative disease resistance protein RGA3 [Salvia hispanica]
MAGAFLQVVLDNLGSLIKDEIGLILGVDDEMQKLSSTLTTLQAVLEDAEEKQIESRPIRDWLQKLNVLAYEIDDILDECCTQVSKLKHTGSKLSCNILDKIGFGHKIGRKMRRVTGKLEGVAAERTKFHLREMPVDRPREVAASRETGSMLNQSDWIYGREEEKDKIVEMLVNEVKENQDISVLPIIGVGGLGKTTLAQLVFNNPRVVDHFDIRIWVCVSDHFELKPLVKAMIEAATGSTRVADMQQLDVVERQLWELLNKKRYLIVLDDVWNDQQEKWFELKDTLSCGSTGASIIVTTRQKKVANIMGTLPAHCLEGLSDENCWMLLRTRAFGPEEVVSPQLEIIGKEIVNKCAGVPLTAKALGGILRFKRTQDEWIYVRESELWKLTPEESLIMPALRLSYHHLPLELRQCFTYFASFLKGHQIQKKELILLWIAHGHISSKGNIQVEDVGNQICNELLLRSLLQSTCNDMINMHDLVHDLAQSVMENKVPRIQSERNILKTSTIREVNLVDRTVLFPKTFQQDMNISSLLELTSLRVLHANDKGIKVLPPSIGNLKHLRYLNLSTSTICMLPNSLCTLWNLQILNLDFCDSLLALPKKLTSLHNLEHLCLSYCKSLSEMPSKMRELTGLKTLSMFVVGVKKGNQLEELQCLNLSGELEIRHLERVNDYLDAKKANIADKKNLRKLRLSWERTDLSKLEEDVDEKVLEALEPHPNLEYLWIEGFSGRYLPRWMTNSTLEKIVVIDVRNCANCMRLPKLGELTHLKRLFLQKMGMEYIIEEVGSRNPVKIQFFALEELHLSGLPNLKRLSKEHEGNKAFPNLKTLWITRCASLILQPLPSLRKLDNLKCSGSTLALLSEQDIPRQLFVEIEESLACFPLETLVKYSKLRSLTIGGAKDISVTREGLEALKKLTSLRLLCCDTMTCIPQGMLQHLTALCRLKIVSCQEIIELPEEIKHLHNLEWLQLSHLPNMRCLSQALQLLSSLKFLHLIYLPELELLPGQLPSLHTLDICDCPKLVSIPALPNVNDLSISLCPQLERRCQRGTGEDWHKISHIRHLRIPYN